MEHDWDGIADVMRGLCILAIACAVAGMFVLIAQGVHAALPPIVDWIESLEWMR